MFSEICQIDVSLAHLEIIFWLISEISFCHFLLPEAGRLIAFLRNFNYHNPLPVIDPFLSFLCGFHQASSLELPEYLRLFGYHILPCLFHHQKRHSEWSFRNYHIFSLCISIAYSLDDRVNLCKKYLSYKLFP